MTVELLLGCLVLMEKLSLFLVPTMSKCATLPLPHERVGLYLGLLGLIVCHLGLTRRVLGATELLTTIFVRVRPFELIYEALTDRELKLQKAN